MTALPALEDEVLTFFKNNVETLELQELPKPRLSLSSLEKNEIFLSKKPKAQEISFATLFSQHLATFLRMRPSRAKFGDAPKKRHIVPAPTERISGQQTSGRECIR